MFKFIYILWIVSILRNAVAVQSLRSDSGWRSSEFSHNVDERNRNAGVGSSTELHTYRGQARRQPQNTCGNGKWQCADGTCISQEQVCDGAVDCSDRSDETQASCEKILCPSYLFKCSYGACVDADAECNGVVECADGSDELSSICTQYSQNSNKSRTLKFVNVKGERSGLQRMRRQAVKRQCSNGRWQCLDKTCIEPDKVCDGAVDCSDRSDETQATCGRNRCPSHLFKCSYGACVNGDAKCNGVRECADGSDELNKSCKSSANKVNKCGRGKFQCDDEQCVEVDVLCDGRADCADGSDETVTQCSARRCASFLFRCSYGACVDSRSRCNNVVDCADSSDEDPVLCKDVPNFLPQTVTGRPPIPVGTTPPAPLVPPAGGCVLPPFPTDGKYVLPNGPAVPGTVVDGSAYLKYSCDRGYDVSISLVYCDEGVWSGNPSCTRRCKMPRSYSVDFECLEPTYTPTTCVERLPHGTLLRSACKVGHHEKEALEILRCESGSWDKSIPQCETDCGTEKGDAITHIVNSENAKKDTFPWHVGIYQVVSSGAVDQICGGSIIHTHLVISAAHCFFNIYSLKSNDAKLYRVAAGKYYRAWDHPSELSVQKSEVSQLLLHDKYGGQEQNHQSDIAIVVLATPFQIGESVRPVCYDLLAYDFDLFQLKNENVGKVAGWGRTESGLPSEELRMLEMPVIDDGVCRIEMANYNFVSFLTADKFCAGYKNGTAMCQGDSGGGLVFPTRDRVGRKRWYLRGVVSNGPRSANGGCQPNTYTAFSQLFKLRDWLIKTLKGIKD